jgi:antitoxin component of MazEF toxin-antitoxin module
MLRKVIQVGSSAAVILPKEALKEQKVRVGDMVDITFAKKQTRHFSLKSDARIDPHVLRLTRECMDEYRDLLNMLERA